MNIFVGEPDNKTCIYVLLESGTRIRYIGITSKRPEQRLLEHYAETSKPLTTYKTNWIRKCLAEEVPITIRVVKSGLNRGKAERMEMQLIRFFGKAFKLVNSRNAPSFLQIEPCRFPVQLALRDKRTGEILWTDFRSVRDGVRWLRKNAKAFLGDDAAKRLSVVQRFYQ